MDGDLSNRIWKRVLLLRIDECNLVIKYVAVRIHCPQKRSSDIRLQLKGTGHIKKMSMFPLHYFILLKGIYIYIYELSWITPCEKRIKRIHWKYLKHCLFRVPTWLIFLLNWVVINLKKEEYQIQDSWDKSRRLLNNPLWSASFMSLNG